jgi:spoIIIJ-associated protein
MLEQNEVDKIKKIIEEFFEKMTIDISSIEINTSSTKRDLQEEKEHTEEDREIVNVDIKLNEPQILIGQQGQTLFEIQRLLKTVLNKKLQKVVYLNLDINDYKNKKVEYLKDLAKDLADQVASNKEEKALMPMSSYERRVIHAELSQRTDVTTESQGDSFNRHIIIKPK